MNDKIKELARLAGFFPAELTQVGPSVEKLVALVVQMCAAKCERAAAQVINPKVIPLMTDQLIIQGRKDQAWRLAQEIKAEFGIE